jgi:hypothetical protein
VIWFFFLKEIAHLDYNHPTGTRDDVFWSIALTAYATTEMGQEPFPAIIPRGKISLLLYVNRAHTFVYYKIHCLFIFKAWIAHFSALKSFRAFVFLHEWQKSIRMCMFLLCKAGRYRERS